MNLKGYVLATLFLSLLTHNVSADDKNFIYNIEMQPIEVFTPKTNTLHEKILLFAKSILHEKVFIPYSGEMNFGVYKFLDVYLLRIPTFDSHMNVLYYPNGASPYDPISYTHNYFKSISIENIDVTRDYLSHSLFAESDFGGFVLDDWDSALAKENRFHSYDKSLLHEKGITIRKPEVIKYNDYEKHVFYVYRRPQKGGTIYRYEIKVKNKHIAGDFEAFPLICFGDTWGYE